MGSTDADAVPSKIGWDDSALKKNQPTKKHDANDYSRFDKIGDDDELENTPKFNNCKNCAKVGAKLNCSVCKKAYYCARDCQKKDWQFHRRICKKPEPKTKPEPRRSSTNKTTATSKPTSASSPPKKKAEVIKVDAEELKDVKGYRYFHREQTEVERTLIGDIAPKPIQAPAPVKLTHDGSAWNSCGTFEERDYSSWMKTRIENDFGKFAVECPDGLQVQVSKVKDIKGDASICVVRGTKRYLYDYSFVMEWCAKDGKKSYKGTLACQDMCNDGDFEMHCSWKGSTDTNVKAQFSKLVGSREALLQKEVAARFVSIGEALRKL